MLAFIERRGGKAKADALRKRLDLILDGLKVLYPAVTCALTHKNDFELLVATILSAQTTDQQVNGVTGALFERYPRAEEVRH